MSDLRFPDRRHATTIACLVVAVITIVAHWPALSSRALCFDDSQYLLENPFVQHPSWHAAGQFLSEVLTPSTVAGYYQPLTMISLMVDSALGGGPAHLLPYHRTSLILHTLNTVLIALLLIALFGRPILAAFVALVFGLHPLTVEPIPWVSDRKTLLAALFTLVCLILYVRYAGRGRRAMLWACLPIYLLAILSKPTSIPLPFLLLVLDAWLLNRWGRRCVIEKIPLFVMCFASATVTYLSQTQTLSTAVTGATLWSQAPILFFHNIAFYLQKMIWPTRLTPFYPSPEPPSFINPVVAARFVAGLGIVVLLAMGCRRYRNFTFGGLFFLIAILPTLQLIRIHRGIGSDKYVYLPCLGFLLLLMCGLTRWARPSGRVSYVSMMAASLAAIVLMTAEFAATRRQYHYWRDTETLLRRMVDLAPQSGLPRQCLGNELMNQGRLDEAVAEHRAAVALAPRQAEFHGMLGTALALQQQTNEAIEEYQEAIRLMPAYPLAHHNLAIALAGGERMPAAIEHYEQAIRWKPKYSLAHFNLAVALTGAGRTKEAVAHYREVLALEPANLQARFNFAVLIADQGAAADAVREYEAILELDPAYQAARVNLAVLLAQHDRYDQAQIHLLEAIRRNPADAEARNNLGIVLEIHDRLDEARNQLNESLRLRPDYADAHYNLGHVLARQGHVSEAAREYQKVLQLSPGHRLARKRLEEMTATSQPVR